ncbi:MAG TPA: ABC transporter ATP-binding protein [Candidatus Acidoferrales bacterium]|nr:ABC transporter ATP-binding protein [Candidatus Acidoferrales bacterium]
MSVLRLENVSKDYVDGSQRVAALVGVSLEVREAEFVTLVGRSGCGKSTLLHLAGAMDLPTSGRVWVAGEDTSKLDDAGLVRLRRDAVGHIFQSFELLPTLSAVENVELPLLLAGRAGARARALDCLAWVELAELAPRMPHQLSGGQLQRVAIARALVHGPRLLLADEPTGNLDSVTSSLILALLRRISSDRGTAILMATHSLELIAAADRSIRLRDGRIAAGD